jgi:hypothetical protein
MEDSFTESDSGREGRRKITCKRIIKKFMILGWRLKNFITRKNNLA